MRERPSEEVSQDTAESEALDSLKELAEALKRSLQEVAEGCC